MKYSVREMSTVNMENASRTEKTDIHVGEMTDSDCLVLQLQHMLDSYDRILLVQEKEEFLKCLENARIVDAGNLLLLVPYIFKRDFEKFGFNQQFLTLEEMEEISQLYYMYDFSNRFSVISDNSIYGNIFDLVKNGLLSYEETLEAILE